MPHKDSTLVGTYDKDPRGDEVELVVPEIDSKAQRIMSGIRNV
jgi:hypothetical protein